MKLEPLCGSDDDGVMGKNGAFRQEDLSIPLKVECPMTFELTP